MDSLSELLADVRLTEGLYYLCEAGAPWRQDIPDSGLFSVYLVTEGQLWLHTSHGRTLNAQSGEMLVLQPNEAHQLGNGAGTPGLGVGDSHALAQLASPAYGQIRIGGGGQTCRFILARGHLGGSGTGLARALPPCLHLPAPLGQTGAWQTLLPMLIESGTRDCRPGRSAMVNRICELLWTEAVRGYVFSLPQDCRGWLRAMNDRYLATALGRMHADPAHPWTVPELACLVGLSRSAFAARFVEVMQESTQAYLTRHRMALACEWLRRGQLSIMEIARKTGYNAETAFSQAFKREMGVSPSQWKSRHRILEEMPRQDSVA